MYTGIVSKIKVRSHPDADRLQVGTVCNVDVIVGLDTKDDDLGIYFPPDGQLSEEFCEANDLVGKTNPKTGKRSGGYFGKNRRVKAQIFRGVKSYGFWIPIDSLKNLLSLHGDIFDGMLKEGDEITKIVGVPVCNKYITPATAKALAGKQGKYRRSNVRFAKHFDTKQLIKEIDNIPIGSILYVTAKTHGCSQRTGRVLTEGVHKRTLWEAFCHGIMGDGFKRSISTLTYEILIGTRNVILKDYEGPGFYGNEEFRGIQASRFSHLLHKGEIVYYEIVGYTTSGQSIMQNVRIPKDMLYLRKMYGDTMQYTYGCKEKECETYVYRITNVNEDGIAIDLSWPQVVNRCKELGIKHVPNLRPETLKAVNIGNMIAGVAGTIKITSMFTDEPMPYKYDGDSGRLLEIVKYLAQGPSKADPSHMREGVVLRVENGKGITCYKLKSHDFLTLEGHAKDKDYVDMEESN